MTNIYERFYNGRIALNVLAKDINNALDIYDAAEGHVLIGVLTKDYPTIEATILALKEFGEKCNDAISIGLGAGDNKQAAIVAEIAKYYHATHINQVFPYVGITRSNSVSGQSWINALVSPSGKPGFVNISTGPISAKSNEAAVIPVEAAISLVRDMGGNSLKYFPMNGLASEAEYRAVAKVCGRENFPLEPTGGIDLNNFTAIVGIALEAGVPQVIPHVYSSIIDKKTGETKIGDIKQIIKVIKELLS